MFLSKKVQFAPAFVIKSPSPTVPHRLFSTAKTSGQLKPSRRVLFYCPGSEGRKINKGTWF